VDDLAKYSDIPIINGLTDDEHPCQVLADLMTIREYKKSFDGLKLAFIGDGNNMAQSLIVGALTLGMDVSIASPSGYTPDDYYLELGKKLAEKSNAKFALTDSPVEAVTSADIVITDVWASMGQEAEAKERIEAFKGYQINEDLMSYTNPNSLVLHCLPAHRDEEISTETFEKHAEEIFDEAENRLHAQKAVLVKLLGNK
jgi:ornithine carbamoyltransferase